MSIKPWSEEHLCSLEHGPLGLMEQSAARHIRSLQQAVEELRASIHDLTQKLSEQELSLGNFSPGRFAWRLTNLRTFEPFPVRGRQGLFEVEVPDELIKAA